MSGVLLPFPEPPEDRVLAARAALELARAELDHAHNTVALVGHASGEWWEPRRRIESRVAELRAELWGEEVRRLESALRDLLGAP